jgi:hypothetical protein
MNAKTTDLLTTDAQVTNMLVQRIMWILWPSFLMAGVLEILVFAMVDPQDLHWFGHAVQLSREGIYTIAFFTFWLVTTLSSAFTVLLAIPALEVNH